MQPPPRFLVSDDIVRGKLAAGTVAEKKIYSLIDKITVRFSQPSFTEGDLIEFDFGFDLNICGYIVL